MACEEGGGDSGSGGGGLFSNHKEATNELVLTPPSSKAYKAGDNLDFKFKHPFEMTITGGPPRIQLDIGGSSVFANYFSGDGTKTLTFRYTVTGGDTDTDGIDITSTNIDLNGSTIDFTYQGVVTSIDAAIPANNTSNILVDTTAPTISLVTPPTPNKTYKLGQTLLFMVGCDSAVDVTGSPRLALDIGGTTRYATYQSGSGTSVLSFLYTVASLDQDLDGIEMVSPLDTNGGTIIDVAGNSLDLTFAPTPMLTTNVDGITAFISSLTLPTNKTYINGEAIPLTLNFSDAIDVTGTPQIQFDLGGSTETFDYVSGSGTNSLLFEYTVTTGDEDADGIQLSNSILLNGGTLFDTNPVQPYLDFTSPLTPNVIVNAIPSVVTSITQPADATYNLGQKLEFTLIFDSVITVIGAPLIPITLSSGTVYAIYKSGHLTDSITFEYTVEAGHNDGDGLTLQNTLSLNGGSLIGSNAVSASLDISTPVGAIDTSGIIVSTTTNPVITSVTPPASQTYLEGENLDFTVNFDQTVNISAPPRIELDIGGTTKYAVYQSGTGTNAALFRYTIEAGVNDADGIDLISPVDLNGGSIQNAGLENATLTFTLPNTSAVLVNTTNPTIEITNPTDLSFINTNNDSATFTISGTCDEAGQTATIEVDGGAATSPVGFVCNGATFSGTIDTTGLSEAAHTLVAKIQDVSLNEGVSSTINVTRDITIPIITSTAAPADNTYIGTSNLDFTVNLDDTVTITGTPRIVLNIGGTTRYADYFSGGGSSTLVFRYPLTSPDEDFDGITISSSLIDQNSGDIQDSSLNTIDLNLDATLALPSTANIFVDAFIPTVSIDFSPDISKANETTYSASGSCSENGRTVSVDIGANSYTPTCSSGSWTTGTINVSGLSDNPTLPITADLDDTSGNNATQASTTVDKDTANSLVAITSSPDINISNHTGYTVSGTCSENGVQVDVFIGSINIQPNCSSGTWTSGIVDVSGEADNAALTITADHDTATQASTTVDKDTASEVVTISSAPNITIANETSYVASGTCSDNAVMVDVNIGALNFTPTCGSGTWTTGVVDVSGLADNASIAFTVDHSTASQASTTISKNTATPTVSDLSSPSTLKTSVDLNWNLNDPGGFVIDDYDLNYRVKGSPTWLSFVDGVDTNTNSTVTGLNASTTYEFRVRVQYDTSNFSDWSNTAEAETKPDSPLFDSPHIAMNVGGSTDTKVVALYDNTRVYLNGVEIGASPLSKGVPVSLTTTQFQYIDADNPIFIAGRKGTGTGSSSANIVWQPTSWAGKSFTFNATRDNPQQLFVFAVEDTTVTIKQGGTTIGGGTITAGGNANYSWSIYGSYQVISTGTILAFHSSGNPASTHTDPKPLMPGHTQIIGYPSNSMRITADLDSTNYNLIHSNSAVASGSLDKVDSIQINPQGGTTTLYQSDALLITADKKISGASYADSNGLCAAPFLPTNLMKTKYVINTNSDYVAFASLQPGSIDVYSPAQTIGVSTPVQTLTLARTGANSNAPYKARVGTTSAGYRFVATVPVAAWYQPDNATGGGDEDETILYGSD